MQGFLLAILPVIIGEFKELLLWKQFYFLIN